MKEYLAGKPISIKIQKEEETLGEALSKLMKSSKTKKCALMILIRTHVDYIDIFDFNNVPENVRIIDSYEVHFDMLMDALNHMEKSVQAKVI